MASGYSVAEQKINLSVLQQKDPYITGIADSASQVAAYSFNAAINEWEKTNIEGTLFVYTRSAFPLNGFMIINRLHLNDLIEPINKNLEFQLQDPFLLYRNSQACIYGIWFYDQDECARIGQLMNSLVQVASDTQAPEMGRQRRASESDSSKDRPATSVEHNNVKVAAISPQRNNVDIMQMLSKAQDEYDKSKTRLPRKPSAAAKDSDRDDVSATRSDIPLNNGGGINTLSPARRKTGTSPTTSLDKQANSGSYDAATTFGHAVSGSGDIHHSNSTHINLETLFRRASQHQENAAPDHRFTEKGIKSAFHMPPLLPPNQTTPTVEEIERAQRESNAGQLGMRGTTLSFASDAARSGVKVTAPATVGSNAAPVGNYYAFQQQNNSRGKHPASESPNTALRRTLNIVPPVSSSGVCPSPASSAVRQRDSSHTSGSCAKSGNTVVQALFSQNQHLQQAAQLCSSVNVSSATSATSSTGVSSAFVSFAHPSNAQQGPNHSIVSDWLSKMGQSSGKHPQPCVQGGVFPASTEQNIKQPSPKTSSKAGLTQQSSTASDIPMKSLPLSEILSRTFTDLAKPETFLANLTKNEVSTESTVAVGTKLLTPMAFQTVGSSSNIMPKTLMNLNGAEISPSLAETTFMSAPAVLGNNSGGAIRNHLTSNRSSSNELPVQNDLEDLQIAPLNKEQLKQALITLLKTDASFLSAIHEAYTSSLNRELSNHKM